VYVCVCVGGVGGGGGGGTAASVMNFQAHSLTIQHSCTVSSYLLLYRHLLLYLLKKALMAQDDGQEGTDGAMALMAQDEGAEAMMAKKALMAQVITESVSVQDGPPIFYPLLTLITCQIRYLRHLGSFPSSSPQNCRMNYLARREHPSGPVSLPSPYLHKNNTFFIRCLRLIGDLVST
jgi:hypothetical protein